MKPIEVAIVEILHRTGPCSLDDIVTSLPNSSWEEAFDAVDRMSRNGRLLLHQRGYSAYQISLPLNFPTQRLAELDRRPGT